MEEREPGERYERRVGIKSCDCSHCHRVSKPLCIGVLGSPHIYNALPAFRLLKTYYLEQKIHNHWAIDMLQHCRHCSRGRLEEVQHFLRFLLQKSLIDLGKISSLKRIQRRWPSQELPELLEVWNIRHQSFEN